jgi:predicted component of type VI protein secretion system
MIDRAVDVDARQLAAVAAFRDLERSGWRAAVELKMHRINVLMVDVGARGVAISPR